jgi:hypothetical protein
MDRHAPLFEEPLGCARRLRVLRAEDLNARHQIDFDRIALKP